MPAKPDNGLSGAGLFLARIAAFCAARSGAVIALWGALAALCLLAAALWLKVDTDPSRMIDPDLSFRQDYRRLISAFPGLDNNFVVIVEADRPQDVRAAALAVRTSLHARPDLFSHVFAPELSPMFETYGPLWMPLDEVRRMSTRLRQAAPMLRILAREPDMKGLSGLVAAMRQAAAAGRAPPMLAGFFDRLSDTVIAAVQGKVRIFDWFALGGAGPDAAPRATRQFIVVKPKLDFTALDPAAAAMAEARRIITDPENTSAGRARIWLTGEAAMNAEEFDTLTTGAGLAAAASFVFVSLVIFLGLPARRLLLPALALVVIGMALNAGFATLAVGSLNMISVAFAVLFIGLGVDYAVHYLLRWAEEAKGQGAGAGALSGQGRALPAARAAAFVGPALVLAALTTILSFLSFVPTPFVGMAQLGIIAAGGIAIALAATLTLLPAILRRLPLPARWREAPTHPRRPHRLRRPLRMGATLLVLALAAACVALLPKVRFDGDPVNLKDPSSPAVIAFNRLLQDDPGIVYALSALRPGEEAAVALGRRLSALEEVGKVRTLRDFLPRDQQAKLAVLHGLRGVIPEQVRMQGRAGDTKGRLRALSAMTRDLLAISGLDAAPLELRKAAHRLRRAIELFLAERGGEERAVALLERALFIRLPDLVARLSALVRAQPVTVDTMDPDLRRWYVSDDGLWRLEISPAGALDTEAAMRRFAAAVRAVAPHATGAPVEIIGASDVVSSAMLTATLIALGIVSVLTLAALRSFFGMLMVLAPIVLAALLLAGYTVVFDAPFNFANVIVIPLLLGLGVDSAIHYVHRAREAASGAAVSETSTPRAIVISALTTMGSFGTLWLTPHRGMSSMGELLSIAIALTLLTTLVVLPQLMDWAAALRHRLTGSPGG